MDAIRARAVINPDGSVTFRVDPGTPAAECEVILLPVRETEPSEAATARLRALAGAWADWEQFDDFLQEIEQPRGELGEA